LPLCAISVVEKYQRDSAPDAGTHFRMRLRQMPEVAGSIHPTGAGNLGVNERGIFALVDPDKLRRILSRMLDEKEFLSDYGILFYEYFHGDNGAGLGASHQTGWTGLVARLIQMYGQFDATSILEQGKRRR